MKVLSGANEYFWRNNESFPPLSLCKLAFISLARAVAPVSVSVQVYVYRVVLVETHGVQQGNVLCKSIGKLG